MRLEAIGKYFAPKSPHITDAPRATSSDSLSISEVMAALGLAGLKSGIGLDLYLAKIGISTPDKAVEGLYEICKTPLQGSVGQSQNLMKILNNAYCKYSQLLPIRTIHAVRLAFVNANAAQEKDL